MAGEENTAPSQNEQTATTTTTEETSEAQSPKSESSMNNSPEPPLENRPESPVKSRSGEKRPLESDAESDSLIPTAKIMPTLRLNIALASDPATNPDAKELLNIHVKTEQNRNDVDDDEFISNHGDAEIAQETINQKALHKAQQQHQNIIQPPKAKENINNVNQLLAKNLELLPRPNVFMCTPCGIRFSSLSTLEAHQTYYCSHRKNADENTQKDGGATGDVNGSEPPTKSIKTGKQYACTQCSYSADKKVSLNRHMRMHQTSPAPSSTTSNGDENPSQVVVQQIIGAPPAQPIVVDRYCSDCDIRFSSTKTYRAHKQHYCSSRHREG